MTRKSLLLTCLFVLSTILSSALAAPDMAPGRWQITSSVEMPGMAFTMPATTHTQCITNDDLVPQTRQQEDICRMIDQSINGDVVTWIVECESQGGTIRSEGKIVYHGDRFEGSVATTGPGIPGGMAQTMTGERIGDCN